MDKDSLEYQLELKLQTGQISQGEYDELYLKFKKLNLLSGGRRKSKRFHLQGSQTVDKIDIDGPVTLSGGVIVDGPVECANLSSSGSVTIIGGLTVMGNTSISGEMSVEEETKLVGPAIITGTLRVNDRLLAVDRISVTGNLIADSVVAGSRLHIMGKLVTGILKSSSSVRINGIINSEGIIANTFEFNTTGAKGGRSVIDGDLIANRVMISAPVHQIMIDFSKINLLTNKMKIPGTGNFARIINKTVDDIIPDVIDEISSLSDEINSGLSSMGDMFDVGLTIKGNVDADEVSLSHVNIDGDVTGNNIKLGSKVKVSGKVRYSSSISNEMNNYDMEKI